MRKFFFAVFLLLACNAFCQTQVNTNRLNVKDSIYFDGAWHKRWPYVPSIEGGVVTWVSGLQFAVTPARYTINKSEYNSNAGTITLNAAHPSLPRLDVIALNTSGQIIKITGTPAASPAIPQIDPATQFYLTSVLVNAGATTPANISNVTIYDENVEWPHFTITGDFDNTTAPQSGSKCIKNFKFSSFSYRFESPVTYNYADFTALRFYLKLVAPLPADGIFSVVLTKPNSNPYTPFTNITSDFGLDPNLVGVWQNISIPISKLNQVNTDFSWFAIQYNKLDSGAYIDNIQLQSIGSNGGTTPQSVTIPVPVDVFIVGGQSNAEGSGDSVTSIKIKDSSAYMYYKGLSLLKDPVGTSTWGSAWPAFAANYYRLTGHKVCIVPTASGGSTQTIAADWYGAPNNWDSTNGRCFRNSIDSTNKAMAALRVAGFDPVIKGILWSQGEGDGRGIALNLIDSNTYYNALTKMVKRFKDSLHSTIPFYIIQSGYYPGYEKGMLQIRKMQDKAQNQDSLIYVGYRNTKEFIYRAGYMKPDSLHYSQKGLNEIGHQLAENIFNSAYRTDYLFRDQQIELNRQKIWFKTAIKNSEDTILPPQVIIGDNNKIMPYKGTAGPFAHDENAPFVISRDKDASNGNAPLATYTVGNAIGKVGFFWSLYSNTNGINIPRLDTRSLNDSLGYYHIGFSKKGATAFTFAAADYNHNDSFPGDINLLPINSTAKIFRLTNGYSWSGMNPSNEANDRLAIFGDGRGKIKGNKWDYAGNYHGNFTDFSLVDKSWVDSVLTSVGSFYTTSGTVTSNRNVNIADKNLRFKVDGAGGNGDSSTFVIGSDNTLQHLSFTELKTMKFDDANVASSVGTMAEPLSGVPYAIIRAKDYTNDNYIKVSLDSGIVFKSALGFLPPRLTTTQRTALSNPPEGLTVYDLTQHKLFVYDGSAWLIAERPQNISASYTATGGQTDFTTPGTITNVANITVYRNGLIIPFIQLTTNTIQLPVACTAGDIIVINQSL